MQEEIFGPVVAFCKARDFDHMMEIANNTDYGLTGALLSNTPEHIERAKEEFHVGNLYFNRGCTGAILTFTIPIKKSERVTFIVRIFSLN